MASNNGECQWQGSFFINDACHQTDTITAGNTSVHCNNDLLEAKLQQQGFDKREKESFLCNSIIKFFNLEPSVFYATFLYFNDGVGSSLPKVLPGICFDEGFSSYISVFNVSARESSF